MIAPSKAAMCAADAWEAAEGCFSFKAGASLFPLVAPDTRPAGFAFDKPARPVEITPALSGTLVGCACVNPAIWARCGSEDLFGRPLLLFAPRTLPVRSLLFRLLDIHQLSVAGWINVEG